MKRRDDPGKLDPSRRGKDGPSEKRKRGKLREQESKWGERQRAGGGGRTEKF